ncbi:phage tail protein [Pseudomonas sp. 18175]|uniref:phage tail-collar fiber domain-containing protein n=1 Tax=Pseudomonas sp. 18175 TaxID=3390056 RepID=UPI003D1918BA
MADYYTLLTDAGIAYETACKAAGVPIKLAHISVGDGNGAVYNPDASAKALKREVWRGPLNALFQDEKNASWLMAEVTIPSDVGGWYVREAGLWTDTGILYAIVKYPESYKPVLATSGSGKEFYIRSIFETSNASIVTLLIDDTVVKATRAWVMDYLKQGTYSKAEIEGLIAKASALPVGVMVPFPLGTVPPGYLEVDNSLFKDEVYPDLAAYLGKKFNVAGDAVGYTRLPESRGEFFRGWDHGRSMDSDRAVGSYQHDTIQNITGRMDSSASSVNQFLGEALSASGAFILTERSANAFADGPVGGQQAGSLSFDASRVVRTSTETRPRNLAVMWCIKAWNAPVNQGSIDIAALELELGKYKNLVVLGSRKNLKLSSSGLNALVNVSADQLIVGTGERMRSLSAVNLSFSGLTVGANGLDANALAASTWYSVWVIWNDSEKAGLLSLSATSPTMPPGYTDKARVGWIRTDSTANRFPWRFNQTDCFIEVDKAAGSNLAVLPAMASGSTGGVAVSVSVSSFVPPTASHIKCVAFADSAANNAVGVFPSTSYSLVSDYSFGSGPNSGGVFRSSILSEVMLKGTSIAWTSQGTGNVLNLIGWRDTL